MTHSRTLRFFAALVCVATLVAFVPPALSDDTEVEDTDEIKEAKAQRDDARKAQLEARIAIELLKAEDLEVVAALEAATELVNLQQAKIDAARQRLSAASEARLDAELALVGAREDIAGLEAAVVDAAVASYIGLGDDRSVAWLNAVDATTGAHKVALLDQVEADAFDALDQLRAVEERRAELAALSDEARLEAEAIEAELALALVDLEEKQAVQIELKAEVDARRAEWEAALDDAEAEEQRLTDWIRAEQDRIEEELRRAREAQLGRPQAGGGIVGGGGWTWPTAGGVASGFGPRLHPILGYYRQHSGLDIGGAQGQPIWAATDGVVSLAGWNGGYGNTVIIGHGEGTTTLYAHMTSFAVSTGTYVSAGQVIGYVGSTGLSTGPHLHFEVRINGVPVDPRPYLP